MRTLIVTLGSAGDLHPFLAVARRLSAQGEDVEVMANAPYEDAVLREGLAFSALCTERDHLRTAGHPDLWHPIRGFGVLWRHLAVPAIEPVRARVTAWLDEAGSAPVRVLASPLAIGARIVREQRPYPLCSVYTAPANLRSTGDPMYLGSWHVPTWLPRPARHALWWALDKWKLDPMGRPAVVAALRAAGLPNPRGSLFGRWIHSPDGGITLFPASFCAAQPDWPSHIDIGDFPLYRANGDDALDPALSGFLAAGPPPVVIFAGSASGAQGASLLREALGACRALGLRVVALVPTADPTAAGQGSGRATAFSPDAFSPRLTDTEDHELVFRCAHAPLELLLPRAAVFIHHGGIGSCAQGLKARTPQLIRPFAYDQFDNAARVEQEGAGRFIPRGAGSRAAFLAALNDLAEGGGAIGGREADVGDARGMDAVVRALERWAARTDPS